VSEWPAVEVRFDGKTTASVSSTITTLACSRFE
jgi:hypothetical protein